MAIPLGASLPPCPMLRPELHKIIEQLCAAGCQTVNEHIASIEAGQVPREMQALNREDRQLVLNELKTIMAVYERCGE